MNTTQNQIIAEQRRLQALYPWAIPGQTSKNAKKLLQKSFPGIKFSVTLDKYSGGSTLHIHWDLGPTPAQVEKAVSCFRAGRFNGMIDLYEYDNAPARRAWTAVMGDVKFVSASRGGLLTGETSQVKLENAIAELLPVLDPHWFNTVVTLAGRNRDWETRSVACAIVRRTSFPAWFDGSTPWRLERVADDARTGVTFEETWQIVLDETFAPVPAPPSVIRVAEGDNSVSVTENPAKNGVEVRFGAKPAPETLAALKANGFRWSPNQGLWYARWSAATLAFARSLVAEEGVPACAN